MEIKIIMHSELDCHLKPDIALIKAGLNKLNEEQKLTNPIAVNHLIDIINKVNQLIDVEANLAQRLKDLKDAPESDKIAVKQDKENIGNQIDNELSWGVLSLMEAGGKDAYHYDYDDHFNMVVAGLMGSTCYMKEDFKAMQDKRIKNIMAIANTVLNNGHHSTFGHSHITLEISGIPKALAMVLNNEQELCTSEKSARYTIMDQIPTDELLLYNKWKEIFVREIAKKYGNNQPFFDAKGVKVGKLAQENARYMISVFTPTNMVYTTSFRQLNYLVHWLENEISNPESNDFYTGIKNEMRKLINFTKDEGLYLEKLEDHKGRKLSLFGTGIIKEHISSEDYVISYDASVAELAQGQRHRTEDYRINEHKFRFVKPQYFLPPLLISLNHPVLIAEWLKDMESVAEKIPQGRLVNVIENGSAKNFILKAMERECSEAQWEIMNITRNYSQKFAKALANEIEEGKAYADTLTGEEREDVLNTLAEIKTKKATFDKLSVGARCTAGYKCARPCGFKEGIDLSRDI